MGADIEVVAPFPEERQAALVRAVAQYAPAELPKGAGRRIAMPR